jgi:hypothetical protein
VVTGSSWVEGHGVAEGLQFTDVVADLAFGVGARDVVARAEVDELRLVVGEQGPDDDEDGAADRDDRPLLAAAAGDPPIPLAEEGVGAGGADCGLTDHPCQVAVALPGAGVALRPAGGSGEPHWAGWPSRREKAPAKGVD